MSVAEKSSPLVRDPWLDNAKSGLIILVVIGHMISSPKGNYPTFQWLYDFINFFHMPAFLVISGYLMKGRIKKQQTDKIINKNLLPYMSAQLLLFVLFCLPKGGLKAATAPNLADGFEMFEPIYQMWFLLGLVLYYFICIALKPEKHPVLALLASYAVSIGLGFFETVVFLRFTKVMCFFPFFLLGYLFTPSFMEKLRKSKLLPVLGLCAFGALGAFVVLKNGEFSPLIYAMSKTYIKYPKEFSGIYPIVARMIFIPSIMVLSLLYLTLAPRKKHFFTKYGERSLYIYVLHAIPAVFLRAANYELHFYKEILQSMPAKVIYLGLSLLIVPVCASNIVVKLTKRFIEPNFDINKFTDYFKNKTKDSV